MALGFRTIGYIGGVNLTILLLITIYKFLYFLSQQRSFRPLIIRKKIVFHVLLILSVLVEIPMYVTFILVNKYVLFTYSFHKLQSTLLLSAYSMTIYDWSNVLYDIQEIQQKPYLFNKTLLIGINIIFFIISLSNFIYCNVVTNIDSFTKSPIYITMIFLQISAELFLTSLMLFSGIQLSRRIHGVTGILRNIITDPSASGGSSGTGRGYSNSFISRICYSITSSFANVITLFAVIFHSFHFRHHTTDATNAHTNSPTSASAARGGGGGTGGGKSSFSSHPGHGIGGNQHLPASSSASASASYRSEQEGIYNGFETALNRLISVMTTCAFCLLVQVLFPFT
jgi:hypothetical protein